MDRQAPDLASGAAGATASPPPAGADGAGGDRPGSADAAAPQAEGPGGGDADGGTDGGGDGPGAAGRDGGGDTAEEDRPEGGREGGDGDGEAAGLPALLRSVEEEVTSGSGDLEVVPGQSEPAGEGPLTRYIVEVEKGLPGEPEDFAAAVEQILADERSWRGEDAMSVQRVDSGPVDFRVALAAPETVDRMCAPLQTLGRVSCTTGGRAIINQNRWVSGVEHFDGDLETYRVYVINHEVGHALGHGHVNCPGRGEPAPVMQQQTFGLQGCEPNGWVHP
ncbi:DUF3152 domain-containing protein [Streptomonospora sp. NEAU-YY374]|nr:DUF3152 domain-containing protein [Streptomonospora nanhaiensis]